MDTSNLLELCYPSVYYCKAVMTPTYYVASFNQNAVKVIMWLGSG